MDISLQKSITLRGNSLFDGCGLCAPYRLGGLFSGSPRYFGGRVARRRLEARQDIDRK
jgi:hypothetical protein